MKVWLVEHGSAFPASAEGREVRNGIKTRLRSWFGRVARDRRARTGRPSGHGRSIDVDWVASGGGAGAHDIVLHFVPSSPTGSPPVMGPYRAAAGRLSNQELSTRLTGIRRAASGGLTVQASEGNRRVPTLSLVFVLYDAQFSRRDMRVDTNVEKLSITAFHEAAHNKDRSNSLHTAGGGGIFGDIHTGARGSATAPNGANIDFFADRIWNWGPQYAVGGALTPTAQP